MYASLGLLFLALVRSAAAHGSVTKPMSKNELAYQLRAYGDFPDGMPESFRYAPWSANHGNHMGAIGSDPGHSCGAKEAAYAEGLSTWQAFYDESGIPVPVLTPGSEIVMQSRITADHGGQSWFMIACGDEINEHMPWLILERSQADRSHHFMPSNPRIYAWESGEAAATMGGVISARWAVPPSFSCPGSHAVGRWLWKTGNSCNDVNNVGRSTEAFNFDEFASVVHAFSPTAHVQAICTVPPEAFISCFDFIVDGAAPTPVTTTTIPTTIAPTTASARTSTIRPTPTFFWTELGGGCCHGTYMDSDSGAAPTLQACKEKCNAIDNCVGVSYGFTSSTWCNLYSGVSGTYTDAYYCSTDTHSSLRCYKSTIGTTTLADTTATTATIGTTTTTTSRAPSTSTFLSTTRTATTTTLTTRVSGSWTDLGGGCCHGTYMYSDSGAAPNLQACKDKCNARADCAGVSYGFASGTWCNLYSEVSGAYTDAYCSTDTHSNLRCYKASGAATATTTVADTIVTTASNTGWKNALWTAYESWPRCCAGNPNYDPTANTDECTKYNGCRWAGYFAYKSCTGANSTGKPGQCTIDFVRNNNLVSFFSLSGEHRQYQGKTIRIEAKGKTIEALVVDTCADSDCPSPPPGCCSTNAGESKDGFLIDMERETVLKHWPQFTDPANQVYSTDMRWQPI